MANTKLTSDQIIARAEAEGGLTPYQIASLINYKFEAAGRKDLCIRPQMMYNYDRNGLIVKGVKNVVNTRNTCKYTVDEGTTFVDKYVSKKLGTNTTPQVTVIEKPKTQVKGITMAELTSK